MERTNIYLTEELMTALDARAGAEGKSRAEVVRQLLGRALADDVEDLQADLAAIDDSFGALRDEPVVIERTDRARAAHLERIGTL